MSLPPRNPNPDAYHLFVNGQAWSYALTRMGSALLTSDDASSRLFLLDLTAQLQWDELISDRQARLWKRTLDLPCVVDADCVWAWIRHGRRHHERLAKEQRNEHRSR